MDREQEIAFPWDYLEQKQYHKEGEFFREPLEQLEQHKQEMALLMGRLEQLKLYKQERGLLGFRLELLETTEQEIMSLWGDLSNETQKTIFKLDEAIHRKLHRRFGQKPERERILLTDRLKQLLLNDNERMLLKKNRPVLHELDRKLNRNRLKHLNRYDEDWALLRHCLTYKVHGKEEVIRSDSLKQLKQFKDKSGLLLRERPEKLHNKGLSIECMELCKQYEYEEEYLLRDRLEQLEEEGKRASITVPPKTVKRLEKRRMLLRVHHEHLKHSEEEEIALLRDHLTQLQQYAEEENVSLRDRLEQERKLLRDSLELLEQYGEEENALLIKRMDQERRLLKDRLEQPEQYAEEENVLLRDRLEQEGKLLRDSLERYAKGENALLIEGLEQERRLLRNRLEQFEPYAEEENVLLRVRLEQEKKSRRDSLEQHERYTEEENTVLMEQLEQERRLLIYRLEQHDQYVEEKNALFRGWSEQDRRLLRDRLEQFEQYAEEENVLLWVRLTREKKILRDRLKQVEQYAEDENLFLRDRLEREKKILRDRLKQLQQYAEDENALLRERLEQEKKLLRDRLKQLEQYAEEENALLGGRHNREKKLLRDRLKQLEQYAEDERALYDSLNQEKKVLREHVDQLKEYEEKRIKVDILFLQKDHTFHHFETFQSLLDEFETELHNYYIAIKSGKPIDNRRFLFIQPSFDPQIQSIKREKIQYEKAYLSSRNWVVLFDPRSSLWFKRKIQYSVFEVLLGGKSRVHETESLRMVPIERLKMFLDEEKKSFESEVSDKLTCILDSIPQVMMSFADALKFLPLFSMERLFWQEEKYMIKHLDGRMIFLDDDDDIQRKILDMILDPLVNHLGKCVAFSLNQEILTRAKLASKKPKPHTFDISTESFDPILSITVFTIKDTIATYLDSLDLKPYHRTISASLVNEIYTIISMDRYSLAKKFIQALKRYLCKFRGKVETATENVLFDEAVFHEPSTDGRKLYSGVTQYSYEDFIKEKALTEVGEKLWTAINEKHPGVCYLATPVQHKDEACVLLILMDDKNKKRRPSLTEYWGGELDGNIRVELLNIYASEEQDIIRDVTVKHEVSRDDPKRKGIPSNFEDMQNTIEFYSQELLCNHSNIEVIRIGSKEIGGERVPAIEIGCQHKGFTPLGEKEFPTALGGYPVCVKEKYIFDAVYRPRLSISNVGEKITHKETDMKPHGSLGPIVKRKDTDGLLTCAHVLCDTGILLGHVSSTGGGSMPEIPISSRRVFLNFDELSKSDVAKTTGLWYGDVVCNGERTYGVDLAVADIDSDVFNSRTTNSTSQETGLVDWPKYQLMKPVEGDAALKFHPVFKCGASTGLTKGMIRLDSNSCNISLATCSSKYAINGSYVRGFALKRQYEIVPAQRGMFAKRGDSGSMVFTYDDESKSITPAGLVVKTSVPMLGGGCQTIDCVAYATPICAVTEALKRIDPDYEFASLESAHLCRDDPATDNNIEHVDQNHRDNRDTIIQRLLRAFRLK